MERRQGGEGEEGDSDGKGGKNGKEVKMETREGVRIKEGNTVRINLIVLTDRTRAFTFFLFHLSVNLFAYPVSVSTPTTRQVPFASLL